MCIIISLDPKLISDILDISLIKRHLFIDRVLLFAYNTKVINRAWKTKGCIKK